MSLPLDPVVADVEEDGGGAHRMGTGRRREAADQHECREQEHRQQACRRCTCGQETGRCEDPLLRSVPAVVGGLVAEDRVLVDPLDPLDPWTTMPPWLENSVQTDGPSLEPVAKGS